MVLYEHMALIQEYKNYTIYKDTMSGKYYAKSDDGDIGLFLNVGECIDTIENIKRYNHGEPLQSTPIQEKKGTGIPDAVEFATSAQKGGEFEPATKPKPKPNGRIRRPRNSDKTPEKTGA